MEQMMVKTLTKLFFGLSMILLVLWNRLFQERFATNLDLIAFSYSKCFFLCIMCIFTSFIFIINIKKLFGKPSTNKIYLKLLQNKLVMKIIPWIQEHLINSPQFLYKKILKFLPLNNVIESSASYFTVYYYPRIIALCLLQMPQMIVAFTFAFDILFFHQLKYFFMSLNILILFLFIRIILFIFEYHAKNALEYLQSYIAVSKTDNGYSLSMKEKNFWPKEEFSEEHVIMQFPILANFWFVHRKIINYMTDIEAVRHHYSIYFTLINSFFLFIGWFTYIIILLCN